MRATVNRTATIQRFANDGFVALRQFVAGPGLSEILSNVDRFIREIVPRLPPDQVFYEDKNDPTTLKQLQHMDAHDPWFHELLARGPFREIAELMLHGPVAPKNLQYFNKPAGVGQLTPPHQDGYYFMLDPCEAVTMWFALDDVDEENGCVRYAKGSHKRGMRKHARTQTLGFSQGIVDYPSIADSECEVAVSASPGDLLIHHAMTVHRADGNRSAARSRRALGFIYYSERAREDEEAHAAYQQALVEDMQTQGKI